MSILDILSTFREFMSETHLIKMFMLYLLEHLRHFVCCLAGLDFEFSVSAFVPTRWGGVRGIPRNIAEQERGSTITRKRNSAAPSFQTFRTLVSNFEIGEPKRILHFDFERAMSYEVRRDCTRRVPIKALNLVSKCYGNWYRSKETKTCTG